MLKDLIILFLIGYLIYKLFSRFVLPVLRITNVANDHMQRMQQQMEAQQQEMRRQQQQYQQQQTRARTVDKEGDFIDYEEIK